MRKIPLDSLFEEFLDSLTTASTKHTYRLPVRRFQNFLKDQGIRSPWDAQESHLLAHFKAARVGYKDSTCAAHRNALRALYQWGKDCRKTAWNPADRLSKVRLHLHYNPSPLAPEERLRLVRRIIHPRSFEDARFALAMALGMFQGFRISEVCKARSADFNFSTKTLGVMGKGSKPKSLPLDPLVEHLAKRMLGYQVDAFGHPSLCPVAYILAQKWFPARPASGRLIQRAFKKLALECKFEGFHRFHHLRHTYLTAIVENGGDIFDVMDLGRIDNAETAMYYVKNSQIKRNRVFNRISAANRTMLETTPA